MAVPHRTIRIVDRVLWGLAIALAVAGPLLYFFVSTTWAFWVAILAAVPLAALLRSRAERRGEKDEGEHFSDSGSGPWGPP